MSNFSSLSPQAIQGVLQGMNPAVGTAAAPLSPQSQPRPAAPMPNTGIVPGMRPGMPPGLAIQPPGPGGSFFGSRPGAPPTQNPKGMFAQPLPTIDPTTGRPIGPNGAGPSGQPSSLYQALMLSLFGNPHAAMSGAGGGGMPTSFGGVR